MSMSLKCRAFLSCQRHHIKHNGTNLQTSLTGPHPSELPQLVNKSSTSLGITHSTPNKVRMQLHRSRATSQWSNKCSIDSSFFLHIQHPSTTTTFLFCRLSYVKIFPNAAVHTKNAIIDGGLTCQILFQGNEGPSCRVNSS